MYMNMRDYPILHLLHKLKERHSTFIAVLHFTVFIWSSTLSTTPTIP
jgi:hypothetical protein